MGSLKILVWDENREKRFFWRGFDFFLFLISVLYAMFSG